MKTSSYGRVKLHKQKEGGNFIIRSWQRKQRSAFLMLILGMIVSSCSPGDSPHVDKTSRFSLAAKEEKGEQATADGGRVWVFKYDGSLQCGTGQAVPLEKMRKELEDMAVYSQEKKSDGLMRIQVCGSPTGYANLYQIDKGNLEEAKEKGFELWEFN